MTRKTTIWRLAACLLCAALLWTVWVLERDRATVQAELWQTPAGDVLLYGRDASPDAPLVLIAHGFAGSVQMMQTIARDLACGGFMVASFDFIGHGRHTGKLSPRVSEIEGTTAQLVRQTSEILDALEEKLGEDRPVALIGHSMATDILIRSADARGDVAAIVAISMYSEAVTPAFPQRLLVISGEWEGRLRVVGLEVVRMLDPGAGEGETVTAGGVSRRTVYAPATEHVAVLYSLVSLQEIRGWLGSAFGLVPAGVPKSLGPAIGAALGLIVASVVTGVRGFGPVAPRQAPRRFLISILVPPVLAIPASFLASGLMGFAGFGVLALFFGVWGAAALFLMRHDRADWGRVSWPGFAVMLAAGLIFALALDRYGAAFWPSDARAFLLALLLPSCVLFMLADQLLLAGARLWQRVVARLLPVATLLGLMLLRPEVLGLLFTTLPVLVLFYLVYGLLAASVARAFGPFAAGIGAGVWLAWAFAASTPLFAS